MSRADWRDLLTLERLSKEVLPENLSPFFTEILAERKRKIRHEYKVWLIEQEYKTVVRLDNEGCVEKLRFKDSGETLEEFTEFFKEYHYIRYIDRGYDCTGQLFTSWYSIFKVNGNWIVYHSIQMDV